MDAKIRGIAANASLSAEEKARAIQELFSSGSKAALAKQTARSVEPAKTCKHYVRSASVLARCCADREFSCRLCHDEQVDHLLDKTDVLSMRCRVCALVQPVRECCAAPTCSFKSSLYFCAACRLWNDDPAKKIFHCAGCGICRIGKREDYFHCSSCSLCFPVDIQGSHHCIAGCADDPCPACQEAMQTSTKEVITMRCGHAMHNECFDAMVCAGNLSCPKCRKSVVRDPIAEAEMRRAIQSTPMPDEYASLRVEVLCNDCGAKCTCAFHVFGHICTHCGSINTAKLRQWQSAPHAALRSAEEAEQEEDALEASDLSGEEDDNTEDDDNFYAAAAGDDDAADGR